MRLLLFASLSVLFLFISLFACYAQYGANNKQPLYQADPTIFYNKDVYFLYGTNGGTADSGLKVFTSRDLHRWYGKTTDNGYVLTVNNKTYGTSGFWAPQIFKFQDHYYIAYTANEHIAIAESNSPLGLFTQKKIGPIDTSIKQIDPFVFFDGDKIYLFHVRLQNGNRIFVEELNKDLMIKSGTLKECISGATDTQPWENTQNISWPVTEGPTVIKRNNLYYLFYSANDFRNPDYAVGYATASSPYGPWKKYEKNPIIDRQLIDSNGAGHGDILKDKKGNLYYVLHTHLSNKEVSPRRTAIIKLNFAKDGSVTADKTTFRYLEVSKQK